MHRIEKEYLARDPRNLGDVRRWLREFGRLYATVKTEKDRRFCILAQLEILSDFAEALCHPDDALKPIRDLVIALLSLDRGVQPALLTHPYGSKPSRIGELFFRARMAAAMEMHHADGMLLRDAGRRVVRKAKVADLKWTQIQDWRQNLQKGDPQTDIGAAYYQLLIDPESGIVPGPSQNASRTKDHDPQADLAAMERHLMHPGERVHWSGGALLKKAEYADWLAETAPKIKSIA